MIEEKEEYQLKLPNGVGEQMLAHAIEKFDVKLEHGEYGPKLIGDYEELEKAQDFLMEAIQTRLNQLSEKKSKK